MKTNDVGATGGVSTAAFRQPEGGDAHDRPLVLPPGTSLEHFNTFMRRVEDVVGIDNATIISDDAELGHEDYMDPSKAHDVSCFLLGAQCQHQMPSYD